MNTLGCEEFVEEHVYYDLQCYLYLKYQTDFFYDSQQSFQREFKKNTGVTPLKYRKQNMWGGGVAKLNTNLHYELSYQGVCFLESIEFSGRNIKYKEVIPYYGFCSGLKWDIISNQIEKNLKNPLLWRMI